MKIEVIKIHNICRYYFLFVLILQNTELRLNCHSISLNSLTRTNTLPAESSKTSVIMLFHSVRGLSE